MDKLIIEGGRPLTGVVSVSGAKNSVLPILAATILAEGPVQLDNVPDLKDVSTMAMLLKEMGALTSSTEDDEYIVDASNLSSFTAPYELVKTMRASFLVLGPLLAKYGEAEVSLPGGCAIGARPVNLHLKGLEAMGAKIQVESGYVKASAPRGLKGAEIYLEMASVGATENLIMAAALAEGKTVIQNAAEEPEIIDLITFLIKMGAKIAGAGTSVIEIEGVGKLRSIAHRIIGDRVEAGTFLIAGAALGGEIEVQGFDPNHLTIVLEKLEMSGANIEISKDSVKLCMGLSRPEPVDVETGVYPGFPTDMQAQYMVLNCIASGKSVIQERIFENRFLHVQELSRLGADIKLRGNSTAVVTGVSKLTGAQVMATDLRASSSLVIAALLAQGKTLIDRIYHIDRGYEAIERKISALGGVIERVS
ncbi:MAG: UDP-N-acetylglucosamine 1-carboxyvinyltransferase [Candidatus Azotimanducaceae bacterium]